MKLPKETEEENGLAPASHGRWYGDACSAALALEILGERWAMLVVRELMLGPRRFSSLRADLPGISAKVLTQRLETLQSHGVLRRRKLPPPAAVQVYELTEWGYLAERPLLEMCRWGVMSRAHDPALALSPTALMLSLRAMFVPGQAQDLSLRVGFEVHGEHFVAQVANGSMQVRRGEPGEADITFTAATAQPLLAILYGKRPLAEFERGGALAVTGDASLAEQVIGLFEMPPKLGTPAA